MNGRTGALGDGPDDRSSQAQRVIDDCMRRRTSGESLSDEQIIASHPDLMPELGQALRKLELIQGAVRQAHRPSSELPTRVAEHAAGAVTEPQPDSLPGYDIMGELHRGGQGVVYRAIQKATQRKVAIKVMKEGPFAGAADRARFEREVHILGQLNHPHIVTIHDSGEAAGHFYYVMDYISGQPLDAYMAQRGRSLEETLGLFAKICDAVNAAHLRGIIHRDLKPGNIRIDTEGDPRILDFGLAKVAASDTEAALMTVTGQFVGSLPWASPEQAEGSPSKIDVRTDVYSLGVILYHMLTSEFPYPVIGNMRDVLDNIMKAEPVRPSTIRRQIGDEVETIVLKCLSKERERRYQTGGELARDVRHYLAGKPIEAKRDSGWYVIRKTLRRYKGPVAAALAVLLTLTAGLVATSMLYARAVAAEANAQGRFNDVRKLANTFLFDFHDKIQNLAGSTPAREFVVETALEYLDKLAAETDDEPSLQRELAQAYWKVGDVQGNPEKGGHLGDTEGAFASYRKALAICKSLSAADPTSTQARRDLAVSYDKVGDVLAATGQIEQALDSYHTSRGIRETLSEADPANTDIRADLALSYCKLGDTLRVAGQPEEALASYRRSLEICEALSAADPTNAEIRRRLATNYCHTGVVLALTGRTEEALARYRKSLEINEALSAVDPTNARARRDLSVSHERIGNILRATGRLEEALASYRKALEIRAALSAADPTNAEARRGLCASYSSTGVVLAMTGQTEEALAHCCKSLEIAEALSAADPTNAQARRDVGVSCFNLARINAAFGSEAAAPVRQRLEYWRAARGLYQRCLHVFADMRVRGILAGSDSGVSDQVNAEIAECDAAIGELEQGVEPPDLTSQPASSPP